MKRIFSYTIKISNIFAVCTATKLFLTQTEYLFLLRKSSMWHFLALLKYHRIDKSTPIVRKSDFADSFSIFPLISEVAVTAAVSSTFNLKR